MTLRVLTCLHTVSQIDEELSSTTHQLITTRTVNNLTDVRATEVFLRTLILRLVTRVVYVTRSFDRYSQEKLVNVLNQLHQLGKEVNSRDRRILVVHNLADVKTPAVLKNEIDVR